MLIHYKCPNCGSDMAFDASSGTLSCSSCGRQDDISEFEDEFIEKQFTVDEAKEYHCENCGAIVLTDKDTTATSCSFCQANVVLIDRLAGELAPAKVIPFSITKEQAQEAFKKWCRNGRLTPDGFMTADRVKNITGMYVPFWIYDLHSQIEVSAVGTKVRTYTRGDYIYTETKYYDLYRDMEMYHVKVPVDASEKMDDSLMDQLEPYNYKDLVEFKTPYLTGYLAEKHNFTDRELFPRAKAKINSYINKYISKSMSHYSTVRKKSESINTEQKKGSYVLFPVWMIVYDLDQQEHTFAMNGQTGKVVGKPPVSKRKVMTWFSAIALASFAVIKVIAGLIGGVWW
ncbi:MAG TPA: TFIIB-type zinc ribbon-containing protein [Pseudogracilibacillus sp.]|nr:TFIIB-type zinc ribbon-containing protein [Pseudogracilibacillus sp.]